MNKVSFAKNKTCQQENNKVHARGVDGALC